MTLFEISFQYTGGVSCWHFCLPHLLQCTFGSAAGSSAGATVHWRFAPYPVHFPLGGQWLVGTSPRHPLQLPSLGYRAPIHVPPPYPQPVACLLCLLRQLFDGSPQAYPGCPSSSEKLDCGLSHEAPASYFYGMDGRSVGELWSIRPSKIFSSPSLSCFCTNFPICLSESSGVYSLPRLRTGCSLSNGIFSPPAFLIERLLDFEGLIFILAHCISSSRCLRSRAVHGAVCKMVVTSSMYPLRVFLLMEISPSVLLRWGWFQKLPQTG